MGRFAALILSLFAISIVVLVLAYLTIVLIGAVEAAYLRWKYRKRKRP